LQAVGPHTYWLQLVVTGAGHELPLQVASAVATPPLQLALRHTVVLAFTAAQVPSAEPVRALLQAMQVPVQALLQQKPSTQAPEAHCPALVHACPAAPRQLPFEHSLPLPHTPPHAPQLAGSVAVLTQAPLQFVCPAAQHTPPLQATHEPPEHCAPAAQLALLVQVVVQALVPQMKGAQLWEDAVAQVPLPSHAGAGVSSPLLHEAVPQLVAAGALRQTPAPLHAPSLPQGRAFVQRLSSPPLRIGAQVPLGCPVFALLQAMQVPQAPEQHTPSTQEPEVHSLPRLQACPRPPRVVPSAPALTQPQIAATARAFWSC